MTRTTTRKAAPAKKAAAAKAPTKAAGTGALKLATLLVKGLEAKHREPSEKQREAWKILGVPAGAAAGPDVQGGKVKKLVVAELLVQRDGERLRLQVRSGELVKKFGKALTATRSAGEWAGFMLVTPDNQAQATEILEAAVAP